MKEIIWTCDNCKKRVVLKGEELPDPPFKHFQEWDFCCIECAREFVRKQERDKRWN